jgi:hypothetical protein
MVPSFLVNSLPKSGTNLLAKAVELFPGIRAAGLALDHNAGTRLRQSGDPDSEGIPLGVSSPVPAPRRALRAYLRRARRASYVFCHLPFSPEMQNLLGQLGMKSLLILRDPRDTAVSMAKYMPSVPDNPLYPYFRPLTEEERITAVLTGIRLDGGEVVMRSLCEALQSLLPWCSQASNYTTYFEKLVGPRGGGTPEAQLAEIRNIADHLGLCKAGRRTDFIAANLFGGTKTFNQGLIGSWKTAFTFEHRRVAKELLGEQLIHLGYERDLNW